MVARVAVTLAACALVATEPVATKTGATEATTWQATKTAVATKDTTITKDLLDSSDLCDPCDLRGYRLRGALSGLLGGVPALVAQSSPLPDVDSFLKAARENLARAQQVAHHYAYKERRTDMHMNPFGRMGMGDTRVTLVRPAANRRLTYRRVIERNGKPVSAADLAEQDAEYQKRVEEVRRRLAREDDDDRQSREQDEARARQRAQMMIDDVVTTLRFQVVRREMRDGVPAIVVTFAGRPEARPVTREGRTARVFKGTIWIHEAAREVMHVEAVATDDVSYGGFIAKLYEGTAATLVRREIDRGVWMPTRIKLTGEARALFRKTKIDFLVEWFDYEKVSSPDAQLPSPNAITWRPGSWKSGAGS